MERNAVAFSGRAIGMTVAGLAVTAVLLGGCGEPKAVPMDDEFAGNSGQSADSGTTGTGTAEDAGNGEAPDGSDGGNGGARQDTGVYADGTYAIKGQYGPVGEDTIDVYLTIADGAVTDVDVVGHPFTTISKHHQEAFAEAVPGVVVGKPLKGLKVDKVAGASWTSDAFNAALDVARQEASVVQ